MASDTPKDIRITVTQRGGTKTASSGSKWEPVMGYSRAVRSGNFIAVTGTVGINADGRYSPSLADQTRRSLSIICLCLVIPSDPVTVTSSHYCPPSGDRGNQTRD